MDDQKFSAKIFVWIFLMKISHDYSAEVAPPTPVV